MANVYSWSKEREDDTYHLPGPDHIGWWAAAAMLASVLLHVVVFFALDRFQIALPFAKARELSTAPVSIQQVEVRPWEDLDPVSDQPIAQPTPDSAALLDEIELLRALPDDKEIDIKPDVIDPEFALQMSKPAQEGDPTALAQETATSFEIEADFPALGREPSQLPPAAVGQLTIDPGSVVADDDNLGRFTDDLLKKGAAGKVEKGALDGVTSLDDLLDLPPNILLSKKTMLPSDLLFEFNQAELRESAKVGLMKLALLMDRNPGLYCWIEGHTDLIGGDEFNLNLSIRRAEAVKSYLVESLRMNAERISTRGFGKFSPIVATGDANAQAINRRVEVRMRQSPPPTDQIRVVPSQGTAVPPPAPSAPPAPRANPAPPEAEAPKAILIQPARAVPVEEDPPAPPPRAPRAQPVEPVEPEVPRAVPVE
jgi:outer membrane protein OmpA-like peptidoglycan-associated protein